MISDLEFAGPIDPSPLDLTGALAAHLKRARPVRDDDHYAHFTDIGRCDLQVHARRSKRFDNTPADRLLFTFEVGHFAEREMYETLREKYEPEWDVYHGGAVIAAVGAHDIHFYQLDETLAAQAIKALDPARVVIGHPDFFLRRKSDNLGLVIDAKTTSFSFSNGVRTAPGTTRTDYILQTAGYAVAFDDIFGNVKKFGVWTACKSGGGDELVMYSTEDYRPMILRRLRELVLVTHPSAPEPPAQPPNYTVRVLSRGPRKGQEVSTACEWCSNTSCPRNENIGEAE